MRTKEQIMKDVEEFSEVGDQEQYLIEALLDIRDLLNSLSARLYDVKEEIGRVARRVS